MHTSEDNYNLFAADVIQLRGMHYQEANLELQQCVQCLFRKRPLAGFFNNVVYPLYARIVQAKR